MLFMTAYRPDLSCETAQDFCASGFRVGFLYSRCDGLTKCVVDSFALRVRQMADYSCDRP